MTLLQRIARLFPKRQPSPMNHLPPDLANLKPDQLRAIADRLEAKQEPTKGSGNAVFLPDMTEEEYQQYIHDEELGWRGFLNKVRRATGTHG